MALISEKMCYFFTIQVTIGNIGAIKIKMHQLKGSTNGIKVFLIYSFSHSDKNGVRKFNSGFMLNLHRTNAKKETNSQRAYHIPLNFQAQIRPTLCLSQHSLESVGLRSLTCCTHQTAPWNPALLLSYQCYTMILPIHFNECSISS